MVGGGIAGLAAAHRATELARERGVAVELTLLEARDRLGGTIETERVDGFVVEAGPDSFLSEKPAGLALCRRLGLEERLVRTDDRFRQVWVWHRGRLHPLPDGFQLLAPTRLAPFLASSLFSWPGKARMALDLVLPRGGGGDESLGAFVRRRLGREALERVAQPLVAGIYTADPDELSLAATMPRFLEVERAHRSIILGLWHASRRAPQPGTSGARWSLFVTFARGMSELVEALAGRLPAGAARLLRYVDPSLCTLLGEITYASSATVSLGYGRADVRHALDGFGFVVPRGEGKALLACTFSSVKYPGRAPEGAVLLRGFLGGALGGAVLDEDDGALVARVRAELAQALGITAEPRLVRVRRHPASMPQYAIGHPARIDTIDRRLASVPGLALAGSAYRGVGIADCVASGESAAERVLGAS
ncbi:MAG: protoporphyrinogen oxidase [Candidatus Rokubacteria bacterium]|nr:protoporphyrinogen oxidase [Candidatus Rokubacteria bacterium]